MSLNPCCQLCGSTKNLSECAACKVTTYCSRDHQITHGERHAHECKAVKKARDIFDHEEQKLRDFPGDSLTPAYPFENSVGDFWGILETRNYMRARFALVEALRKLKTYDAVRTATEHIRDMLRLCRSDNMGVRDLLPALLLRLGQDQQCYDFIKWWQVMGRVDDYDWCDTDLPFLSIEDANVFESVGYLCSDLSELSHLVCVVLLKVKLLLDLENLANSAFLGGKLPQELADRVRHFIPLSSIVREDIKLSSITDHARLIKDLSRQVDPVFRAVARTNEHFWPALLSPAAHMGPQPRSHSAGSVQEMQLQLNYSCDAWNETPGALHFVQELQRKQLKGIRSYPR